MAALFLDASGVAKRYVQETGSAWVRAQTNPAAGNGCFLGATTSVEVLAAIYRKARTGALNIGQAQQAEQVLRQELKTPYKRIALRQAILDQAMNLVATHPLRGFDAVQLASRSRPNFWPPA